MQHLVNSEQVESLRKRSNTVILKGTRLMHKHASIQFPFGPGESVSPSIMFKSFDIHLAVSNYLSIVLYSSVFVLDGTVEAKKFDFDSFVIIGRIDSKANSCLFAANFSSNRQLAATVLAAMVQEWKDLKLSSECKMKLQVLHPTVYLLIAVIETIYLVVCHILHHGLTNVLVYIILLNKCAVAGNAYSLADYVIMSFGREGIDAKKGGSDEGIAGNTPPVDLQDHVASLKASSHQSEVKTNTVSPAMQPQSGLIKEAKTTITNVAPDSIQGATSKHLPPRTSGIQGTIVGSSIKEEWHTTTGSRWDQKTEKNIDQSIQPTKSIDVKFLQQVAFAFEEVNGDQEGNTKLAKKAINMDSNLESTFQAICKKHGNIAKDFLLESGDILTSILKVICEVVLDLQKKCLSEVDRNLLDSYYLVVKDAEKLKVDVKWLRTRLDEIKDAISCIVEKNKINDERNKIAE
ncbi:hypothetical protein CQW23_14801 [Capsicum baccatum]|uniref:Uncharacterized protein n=1 Tax=Capsicum baccatum TaxID=33114 RepID=A0A2G2WK75_CAPBA|nr:hypothetical protein CQW23_14801 [Capsicum baccatum]